MSDSGCEHPEIRGTTGYRTDTKALVRRYESIAFIDKHREVLPWIPSSPSRILDIGAGTGADAAYLADAGHQVVAVEPTAELRRPGMALHPSPDIEWLDDSLPDLKQVRAGSPTFDVVMITAVWMHLDAAERRRAMPSVASLITSGGTLILSLRHGPVPANRYMFDVTADETIELARANGLNKVLCAGSESVQTANRRAGITWSKLVFGRP